MKRKLLFPLIVALVIQTVWAGGHSTGGGTVHVRSFYRKDGTYVHAYDRVAPGTAGFSTSTIKPSTAYVPAISTPNIPSAPIAPTTTVAPQPTPDLRSNKQTVQDAITAGRIVVSDPGTVHVNGYYRPDGTYVSGYDRAAPGTVSSSQPLTSQSTSVSTTAPQPSVSDNLSASTARTTPRSYISTSRYSSSIGGQRDSHGRIKRSEAGKHEFMSMTGYLHGRPGYVVDHIIPLKRGGCDCPSNMQWQTIQEAKAKDKWE
jgi:hypothetical protein